LEPNRTVNIHPKRSRRLHSGSLHWPRGDEPQLQINAQQWQALIVGLPWRQLAERSIRIL